MKNLINVVTSGYFTYSFIFNFNEFNIYLFYAYLFLDTLYFILLENNSNKLRNDIIIHHINSIVMSTCKLYLFYYYNVPLGFNLFLLQETTTFLICINKYFDDVNIKKYSSNLLNITWIPLRFIIPIYCIFYNYSYNYLDNISFKLFIISACVFLFLNVKWTLMKYEVIQNNQHYSSLLLLLPIIHINQDVTIFTYTFLLSFFSFLYNVTKEKITLILDTSMVTLYPIQLYCKFNLYIHAVIFIILSSIKHIISKSELHSIIAIIYYIQLTKSNLQFLIFNSINIIICYTIRHFTRITFFWHLSSYILITSIFYLQDKLN